MKANGKKPNMSKRYTEDFKKQIVELINNGKAPLDIIKEYNISRSSVHKWVSDYGNSGSFKTKDNRSEKENALLNLRKENKELKMENDILKQAVLILGRK